jgi:serine/threonine protein kinase
LSELKLISPLLDHMSVVSCLGSHGGVSCYVLKHESLSTQFVLKHISIPQSEEKTAALLLAGAFADEAGAHAYYGQLVEDLEAELALARRLSETQNFLVPLGAQAEPKASGVGYDFYILSPMRRSLRAFLAENAMTNLKAVNCGIDLCNALCALREQNLLFRDLRPENIYLNEKGRFLLGDLGLSETELLQFSSLPESDKSDYTPPEFSDMMANLNLTMDTYALGMTLYRIYNGNHGPFEDEKTSHTAAEKRREAGEALPAPLYADYELAEILCKACAPKPEDRYASPDALRQALVFYMQRNSIADDLIVPPILTDPDHQPLGDNPEEEIEPVSFTDVSALDTEFVHSFMPDVAPLPAQNEKGSHAPAAPQPVPEPPEAPAEASERLRKP